MACPVLVGYLHGIANTVHWIQVSHSFSKDSFPQSPWRPVNIQDPRVQSATCLEDHPG